ncbi:MAG: glycosyltransferase family A protein, partial [Chlorobium sp.]
MSYNPLVTVIIPCYNHAKYISQCIESVISQTYKNIELIVIDNGSTDSSYDEIKKYLDLQNFQLIRHAVNIPPGVADGVVSLALKKAKGEYISVLYSDDWFLPEKIEKQIDCFICAPSSVGVVYCHGYRYFETTGNLVKWDMGSERGYVFPYYLKKGDLVIPVSPLVKKYCYNIIGTDHQWSGSEFDYFAMSQFVDFDYVDEHLVVMRDHDSNDAKNIESVYARNCAYNDKFFSNHSTI